MARNFVVADIGGTHIRAACFPTQSTIPTATTRTTTRGAGTPQDRLMDLIASINPVGDEIAAIAVSAPGPLDPFEGIIFEAPNIPSWTNLPLKKLIEARFHVPVAVGNDGNLAALGEWKFGAGVGHHHLVYLTVGTGIGGGVIIDDQLLLGAHGLGAELGHITIIPDGPLCGCGKRGHLEALASGPAIARWAEEELRQGIPSSLPTDRPITTEDVSSAASKGDELAIAALTRAGSYLGVAVADYLHVFNPSIVVIGGGVSQIGEIFLAPVRQAMNEHALSAKYLENLVLTLSSLGDDAGLMGALAIAQTLGAS